MVQSSQSRFGFVKLANDWFSRVGSHQFESSRLGPGQVESIGTDKVKSI